MCAQAHGFNSTPRQQSCLLPLTGEPMECGAKHSSALPGCVAITVSSALSNRATRDKCIRSCVKSPLKRYVAVAGVIDLIEDRAHAVVQQLVIEIEPDIIIFDESTSMLDPQGKASINAQIRKLHEEKNITILSITHDMEEVAQSENVIVLENGEIAMQGTPMDIFKQEDKLAKMQLDIPFVLKISKELKKRGIFKENVCRLDEVVEKLCRLK